MLNSGGSDQRYDYALKLINQKEYEKALRYLRKIIVSKKHENNADYWNLIGFSSRKIGKFDEAHEAYARALSINPKHIGATEYLGELYVQTGERAKAEAQLEKLKELCAEPNLHGSETA